VVVFYTDGISEAMNEANEEFGQKRLAELVARERGQSASAISSAVEQGLRVFSGERPAGDDRTLLIVRLR
jgi:sigma-B regulation protein RsbU (phosphoserine phosphatase)